MAGALYTMKEAGFPINRKYLDVHHPVLCERIQDYPGGWRKVVQEAGFDPAQEAVGRIGYKTRNSTKNGQS
ncbi:MAG: hypothetical protein NUV69_05395 [Candidatus Curtissbacteria bacterium]|nr:hypothetical protein [Candidatus Curtissbacteria bacterium]